MKASHFITVIWMACTSMQSLPAQILTLETGSQKTMPSEWIDRSTGHHIKRLTPMDQPNESFYFHNNPFLKTPDGKADLMIYYRGPQLYVLNLKTMKHTQLTDKLVRKAGEIVGKIHREVFYQVKDSVFATHIDRATTRLVCVFPADFKGSITTLNADETLLAGSWATPAKDSIYKLYPAKGEYFDRIFDAKIPHTLFTINLKTGALEKIHSENTWLGHIQFSVTDPNILMFCHEGPWHKVDRIWNINLKTKVIQKIHSRTMEREIAGHEFWSWDGKTIWYDLQIPRGETFYLAGYRVADGQQTRYQMLRDEWSIHFNISRDQKLFCGDGGNPSQVAKAKDGMWIYLFHPEKDHLRSERLVNMKLHDYRLEPNVHFSPDGKWVVFRANFEGMSQIYAVEL